MYNEIEIKVNGENKEETKVVKFRLTSANCMLLEEKTKKGLFEYLQEETMTMAVTLLRYMRMWELPQFSTDDAQKLYDELVDNGYTFKRIVQDIIYETLVVSGFLERADWEEIKKTTEEMTKRLKETQTKALKNI